VKNKLNPADFVIQFLNLTVIPSGGLPEASRFAGGDLTSVAFPSDMDLS